MKVFKLTLLLAIFCIAVSTQSCEDPLIICPDGYMGTDCEDFDPAQVQVLLDAGKTPLELINGNIPLSSLYGKMYEGGLIFYLNTNTGSGMVAAATDQSTGVAWGCSGQEVSGADGQDVGTGSQNTMDILGGCITAGIAARLCDELELKGYTDWFLPSKDELNLMWTNLADSDGDGQNSGTSDAGNLGDFASDFYWSSTEFEDTKAWYQFFTNNGSQNGDYKTNLNRVRAVRTF